MKKIFRYLKLRFFSKYYLVSGTFDHEGERKWFRLVYRPESGYVIEEEVLNIWREHLKCDFKYFVITNFNQISPKQYLYF